MINRIVLFLISPLFTVALGQSDVTVWTHYTEVEELEWLKAQAEAYESANGVSINIVEVPFDDIRQKLVLGAAEGEAADLVVSVPQDWVGEIAASGAIEPLEAYIDEAYLSEFEPIAVGAFTYDGRVFGLPMFAEALALIYNKDIIETPPQTWEEFIEVAEANTTDQTFGFLYQLDIPYYGYGFWNAYGGYLFNSDTSGATDVEDIGLGGEAGIEAANLIKDLRFSYNLVPEGVDYGVANSAFTDGVLAMTLNGPWAMGDYRSADLNFGIAPLPTPPGAESDWGPLVGVQGIILNAYSNTKTEAVDFAKYLVSAEQQISFNQAGGRIPVSLSAVEELADDPVVQGFSQTIALGDAMPNVPQMSQVWGAWGNALQLILQSPDSDVESIINDMSAELEATE